VTGPLTAISRERAEVIARRWAGAESRIPGVCFEVEVVEVEDGFLVDVVAYRGVGPFETLGRARAIVDTAGRIREQRVA